MAAKRRSHTDEKLPLKLTAAERKLVLEGLNCLDQNLEQIVRDAPIGQPVWLTLDDLDDLVDHVAADANHCQDKSKAKKLDAIRCKIQSLLEAFIDKAPHEAAIFEDARNEHLNADQRAEAAEIARFAALAHVATQQLKLFKNVLDEF